MGRQFQKDLGVADGDFRVVLRLFGDLREVVHEIDRVVEFLELDGPGDGFFLILPFGAFFQCGGKIVGFEEVGHGWLGEGLLRKIAASASALASLIPRIVKNNKAPGCEARGTFLDCRYESDPQRLVDRAHARFLRPHHSTGPDSTESRKIRSS